MKPSQLTRSVKRGCHVICEGCRQRLLVRSASARRGAFRIRPVPMPPPFPLAGNYQLLPPGVFPHSTQAPPTAVRSSMRVTIKPPRKTIKCDPMACASACIKRGYYTKARISLASGHALAPSQQPNHKTKTADARLVISPLTTPLAHAIDATFALFSCSRRTRKARPTQTHGCAGLSLGLHPPHARHAAFFSSPMCSVGCPIWRWRPNERSRCVWVGSRASVQLSTPSLSCQSCAVWCFVMICPRGEPIMGAQLILRYRSSHRVAGKSCWMPFSSFFPKWPLDAMRSMCPCTLAVQPSSRSSRWRYFELGQLRPELVCLVLTQDKDSSFPNSAKLGWRCDVTGDEKIPILPIIPLITRARPDKHGRVVRSDAMVGESHHITNNKGVHRICFLAGGEGSASTSLPHGPKPRHLLLAQHVVQPLPSFSAKGLPSEMVGSGPDTPLVCHNPAGFQVP